MNLKIKRVTFDLVLNIVASSLPTILLQLVIQPLISRHVGIALYGNILTIISCLNICIGMFGTPLNNTRLLEDDRYKKKGDFNILLVASFFVSILLQFFFFFIYEFEFDIFGFILLVSFNIISIYSAYLSVEFRLIISYKKILLSKLFLSIGYFFGLFIFFISNRWELIFFFGALFELIFIIFKTRIWKEPFVFTPNLKSTIKRFLILIISTALLLIITYADRLIIYPAFGSADVSIYYSATIIGKIVLLATNPIGGVMLTYVSKMKEIKKKYFLILLSGISLLAIVGYILSCIISGPVIQILYPDCFPFAMNYVYIANATTMIGLFYSFIWPLVFKFGKKSSPLIITIVRIFTYLTFSLCFLSSLGLYSVCYGNLISTIVQAFIVILMGFYITRDKKILVL